VVRQLGCDLQKEDSQTGKQETKQERIEMNDDARQSGVRIVKLKTGEELIATVVDLLDDGSKVFLKKPCIIVPTAQNQIGLAPWAFVTKEASEGDGIPIPRSEILYFGTPLTDLWNEYNSIFGSKLMLPNQNISSPGLKLSV
jgi:hypothetical protein